MPTGRNSLKTTPRQPPLSCGSWEGDDLVLPVRVSLARGNPGIAGVANDQLRLRITAAPVDGKANDQAIKILAKMFGVAKNSVELRHGSTNRNKLFRIASPSKLPAELLH